MQYDLTGLGPHHFEDLVRDLAVKIIGPGVTVFGQGPDGGREATYDGVWKLGDQESWAGLTVIQAKFRREPRDPANNLDWLKGEMRKEMRKWGDPSSARSANGRLPNNLIIVTNVALSSTAGGGIDTAPVALRTYAEDNNVRLAGTRVWPAQQLAAFLSDARSIRLAYGGLITPGDVLGQVVEQLDLHEETLARALDEHISKEMLQARWIALDSAGSEVDRVSLGAVAVDLPARTPTEQSPISTLDWIIDRLDRVAQSRQPDDPRQILLLGGPGNGKTTLTAILAQTYRIALLRQSSRLSPEAARLRTELDQQFSVIGLRKPLNRRWPIRVDLAAFAEAIAGKSEVSLLRYLARRVSVRSAHDVTAAQLGSWLAAYPWLLVLDGFDEVASAALRQEVVRAISDFLVDASSRAADVVVLVTTRPQGYANELDPRDFLGVELVDLNRRQAIAYADRLAAERHRDDPDLQTHIHERLMEASRTPMTSRLMRTPLQVTIMSRLLERRQRVPHERFGLFDAYFEVIYAREQNKQGHVAQLLESRRGDVLAVHERVALLCQVGAENDEAGATISRASLQRIAEEHLVGEGHSLEDAAKLAETIAIAALSRLVLLVPQGEGDRIGFEVRSLQEYMAARALTSAEGPDVLPRLQKLVPAAHWRNTWLFAAGRLFRDRQYLRDGVIGSLHEFDSIDELHQLAAPGAGLAAALVDDGLAATSPLKGRALASHALEQLRLPPGLQWDALASTLLIASEDRQIRDAIERVLEASLASTGGARATGLLMLNRWKNSTGALAAKARQLSHQHKPGPAAPGLSLTLDPGHRLERTSDTLMLSNYLDRLLKADTSNVAATSFALLFRRTRLHSVPVGTAADPWVVTVPNPPDVAAFENLLATGTPADIAVRTAVSRLVSSIPNDDWHVASTIRAMIQHWLERRPHRADLLAKTV